MKFLRQITVALWLVAGVCILPAKAAWVHEDYGHNEPLNAICHADGTYYACGNSGLIITNGAAGWTDMTTPASADLMAIDSSGYNNVWAVGDSSTVLYFDGYSWTQDTSLSETYGEIALGDVTVTVSGTVTHVYASGSNQESGFVFHRTFRGVSGSQLSDTANGAWEACDITRFWGAYAARPGALWAAHENAVFAIVETGVQKWNGSSWSTLDASGVNPSNAILRDVWGTSADSFYIVGLEVIAHWNGSLFEEAQYYTTWESYHCVTGTGASNVWVGGTDSYTNGTIPTFDGSAWSSKDPNISGTGVIALAVASETSAYALSGEYPNNLVKYSVSSSVPYSGSPGGWLTGYNSSGDENGRYWQLGGIAGGPDGMIHAAAYSATMNADASDVLNRQFLLLAFDSNGNAVRTKEYNTPSEAAAPLIPIAIDVDSNGNIFVCGHGDSAAWSGALNTSESGSFVMKASADGTVQWVTMIDSSGSQGGIRHIVADNAGGCVIAGNTNADWGGIPNAGSVTLTPGSTYDIYGYYRNDAFIARLDASGSIIWRDLIGQDGSGNTDAEGSSYREWGGEDFLNDIAIDTGGNIYLVGLTAGALGSTHGGAYDPWMAKYSSSGTRLWLVQHGVPYSSWYDACAAMPGGNIAVGMTVSTYDMDLDHNTYRYFFDGVMASGSNNEIVIRTFSSDGQRLQTQILGGYGNDGCSELAAGADGSLLISGTSSGDSWGDYNNNGGSDWLVIRLTASGSASTGILFGSESYESAYDIVEGANGQIILLGYAYDAVGGLSGSNWCLWGAGDLPLQQDTITAGDISGRLTTVESRLALVLPDCRIGNDAYSITFTLGGENPGLYFFVHEIGAATETLATPAIIDATTLQLSIPVLQAGEAYYSLTANLTPYGNAFLFGNLSLTPLTF